MKSTRREMNETSEIGQTNEEVTYSFRFGPSNKLIRLTQQQLDATPYLSALVAHKDDFLSSQNESGEYVLSSRIRYTWFIAILRSITTEHPSVLFTELSQDVNVLGMLRLHDYLCVNPLSVPLLKDVHLARSNSINTENANECAEYRRASPLEARDTAV
ncbi:unnamed protein product, partial [Rotaria sordida]